MSEQLAKVRAAILLSGYGDKAMEMSLAHQGQNLPEDMTLDDVRTS